MAITHNLFALPMAVLKACGVTDTDDVTEFTLRCTLNGHTLRIKRQVWNADTSTLDEFTETWTKADEAPPRLKATSKANGKPADGAA